tara:strand:+ start:1137 stop:1313 length:177 start_codon:yes stop_codon:yes gene_type:complete
MNEQLEQYLSDIINQYGEEKVIGAIKTMEDNHKRPKRENKYQLFRMYISGLRKERKQL